MENKSRVNRVPGLDEALFFSIDRFSIYIQEVLPIEE